VVAAIETENTNRNALNAIKQAQRYDEEYHKASAQHKRLEANLKILEGQNTEEKVRLTAEIRANRQLMAGCLRGYADSLAALIRYSIPRIENMTKAYKEMSLERKVIEAKIPASKKEEKKKARLLAEIGISQAKLLLAQRSLLKCLDYLGMISASAKSRAFFLDPDAVANIMAKIENEQRYNSARE